MTLKVASSLRREDILTAERAVPESWFQGVSDYRPYCEARLMLLEGQGFLLRMLCREENPRVTVREADGPVFKDSCMEFFVNFAPERSGIYLNMEFNAAPALLCRMGESRNDRQNIPEALPRPELRALKIKDGWGAELLVPFELIEGIYGPCEFKRGSVLRGNFYKCGDETRPPHYGMWSEVISPVPDFHRPEYFGELIIE